MKICFSPEQFFDNEGVVLAAGRISIYYAGTDNLVPLYHFQANEYVSAENPVEISDSGRIDSVFFDSAIVSVKVEKRLDDDTFEQVTAYEYGIDVPGGKSDTVVTGISALKEASPTLGAVTVVGYRNQYDVGPRTYVWDPNAIDQPDDGCVVASSVEVTGRWLLLWNDEILPAGIHGVTPGHIENMAALMSRPRIYGGSYSIVAPGTTGFPGGNFASSNSYTTTYDLMLDRATRFGDATITAPKIDVSGLATEAEANFQIRKPEGVGNPLKLSLVKSRTQVGATNADVIIVDKDNTSGSAQITLYNKLVYADRHAGSYILPDRAGEGKDGPGFRRAEGRKPVQDCAPRGRLRQVLRRVLARQRRLPDNENRRRPERDIYERHRRTFRNQYSKGRPHTAVVGVF